MLFRIALANLLYPKSPAEAVTFAVQAVEEAAAAGAGIVCFPECFVPGYRIAGRVPPPDAAYLKEAWSTVAAAAGRAKVAVILATERILDGRLLATALVIGADGERVGFQDKIQIPPEEEGVYEPGSGSRVLFQTGMLKFGIVICHEGWRYPETVRAAARQGAHIVFHPQLAEAEPGSHRPTVYADPANTFHEKAVLCRAAENTCYFATVNYASDGSPTTSAVARPDGTLQCFQPYGQAGLLIADIDLSTATGLLASRCKPALIQ